MCAHHIHLRLYGGGAGDVLACSLGLAGATTVATSRVIADRHYVSDVVAGAVVGFASGYLLPELLHYRFEIPSVDTSGSFGSALLVPAVSQEQWGVALVGMQ